MNDTTRADFEAHCKKENPAYKPSDDSFSNRRDWAFWQAATLAERESMADSLAAKGFADSCVAIVRTGK